VAGIGVVYITLKERVKPTGPLKATIEQIDLQLNEALSSGQTSEVRRLLAKGITLLGGRDWTDALDFSNSLVLRSDRVFLDATQPVELRLEQIYSPRIKLDDVLSVRLVLQRQAARPGDPPQTLYDFGVFDDVPRDLRDVPFRVKLDLKSVPEGPAFFRAEALLRGQLLGAASILPVNILNGLDERLRQLEVRWDRLRSFEELRGEVLYPGDYIRKANSSKIARGTFNPDTEIGTAAAVLDSLERGKDPFFGKTGEFKRHSLLAEAAEIMPYHIYVPTSYDGTRTYPLIIDLHGLNGNEDSPFSGGSIQKLAEERGYIIISPSGFRGDAFFGFDSDITIAGLQYPATPETRKPNALAESDVLNALQLMRQNYKIDPARIYLLGASMGAIGTWHLGAKHPEIWAALAPVSGLGDVTSVERMKHIPEIVVHGDADATINVENSRKMVAELKRQGVDFRYIEVAAGTHNNVFQPNLEAIFNFFDNHRK